MSAKERHRLIPEIRHEFFPVAIAMTAPAVRMVVVCAWAWREDNDQWCVDHEIKPVLAIMARHDRYYTRCGARPADPPVPNHRRMEDRGWTYQPDGQIAEFDVIIFDQEFELTNVGFLRETESNTAYEIVVSDWPAAEDPERLAEAVVKAREAARKLAVATYERAQDATRASGVGT